MPECHVSIQEAVKEKEEASLLQTLGWLAQLPVHNSGHAVLERGTRNSLGLRCHRGLPLVVCPLQILQKVGGLRNVLVEICFDAHVYDTCNVFQQLQELLSLRCKQLWHTRDPHSFHFAAMTKGL